MDYCRERVYLSLKVVDDNVFSCALRVFYSWGTLLFIRWIRFFQWWRRWWTGKDNCLLGRLAHHVLYLAGNYSTIDAVTFSFFARNLAIAKIHGMQVDTWMGTVSKASETLSVHHGRQHGANSSAQRSSIEFHVMFIILILHYGDMEIFRHLQNMRI